MARHKDITGQRFGRLIALERKYGIGRYGTVYWTVRCDCGTVKNVDGSSLRRGLARSCGCLRSEVSRKYLQNIWHPNGSNATDASQPT